MGASHGTLESCPTTPELMPVQDWEEQGEATVFAQLRKALERTAGLSEGDLTLCHFPKTQSGDRHGYRILMLSQVYRLAHTMPLGADLPVSTCLNSSGIDVLPRLPPASRKCTFHSFAYPALLWTSLGGSPHRKGLPTPAELTAVRREPAVLTGRP